MILEAAHLQVRPGQSAAFEAAFGTERGPIGVGSEGRSARTASGLAGTLP